MQYQILHRIVPTNNYLYKIKLKDSPLCSFCKLNIETIEHLFTECPEVKDIWYRIEELFLTKYNVSFVFDKRSTLFGKYNNNKLYRVQNLLILIVKQYIFSCKFKPIQKLDFFSLSIIIADRFLIQKFMLLKNCKYLEYEREWKAICDLL